MSGRDSAHFIETSLAALAAFSILLSVLQTMVHRKLAIGIRAINQNGVNFGDRRILSLCLKTELNSVIGGGVGTCLAAAKTAIRVHGVPQRVPRYR